MEKLSSILPSSPRVKNVDMTDAHPVRPGAPTFGRPVGVNVMKDRFTVSQQAKDIAFKETLAGINPKEAKGVQIADQMSKTFFDTRLTEGIKAKPASEETLERAAKIEDSLPEELPAPDETSVADPLQSGKTLDVKA